MKFSARCASKQTNFRALVAHTSVSTACSAINWQPSTQKSKDVHIHHPISHKRSLLQQLRACPCNMIGQGKWKERVQQRW